MKIPLLFLLLAVMASSCSRKIEDAPAPTLSNKAAEVTLPMSTVNIPISLPYADIASILNRDIGELLYEDRDYNDNGGDDLMLIVKRTAPMRVGAKGEFLQVKVPLNIYVKARVKSTLGGLLSNSNAPQLQQDAQFNIEVTLSSKVQVLEDWRVQTQSQVSFKWTERPYLEVGILKIPIGTVVEKVVEQQLARIAATLDAEAKKQLQFKSQVAGYWKKLFEPIAISGPVPAMLYLAPDSIFLAPLVTDATALRTTAGIRTTVLLSTTGEIAGAKRIPKPVPNLRVNQPLQEAVQLRLVAGLDYATATRLANENLSKQTFSFENGKHQIRIEDILLYGKGNTLVAKVKLVGKAKAGWIGKKKIDGTYYFKGTPYYDAKSMEIRIKDFDFDIKSRDILLQSAEWLFKSTFRKQVEAQLRHPIQKELAEVRKMAENSIKQQSLGEFLTLSGRIDRLEPNEVQLSERYILLFISSSGSLSAFIKP
jgi:hypothetical protein